MGEISNIAWTDASFNPWWGCTKVSPGCDFCYAERDALRYGSKVWGHGVQRRIFGDKHWMEPLRWNKKARNAGRRLKVFSGSMCDILDNEVDQKWRDRLWELVGECDWIDWQLLTKRIGNADDMVPLTWITEGLPSNVWFGISIVNQQEADRDIPKLLSTFGGFWPGHSLLWLSIEPQLAPITLNRAWMEDDGTARLSRINWVVVGGESGPRARPCHPDWIRSLRDQCQAAGVPFFFKQWGEWAPIQGLEGDLPIIVPGPRHSQWTSGTNHPFQMMRRVGKKKAGALIDGREWREFPR